MIFTHSLHILPRQTAQRSPRPTPLSSWCSVSTKQEHQHRTSNNRQTAGFDKIQVQIDPRHDPHLDASLEISRIDTLPACQRPTRHLARMQPMLPGARPPGTPTMLHEDKRGRRGLRKTDFVRAETKATFAERERDGPFGVLYLGDSSSVQSPRADSATLLLQCHLAGYRTHCA